MFGRRKGGKDSDASRLRNEAKPNELSWQSDDALETDEDLDEDDDLDEEVDAEFAEDDEEDDEAEVAIAERQLELQHELERQAEEFGLANQSATAVYGDNGEAVADLLDRLEEIDVDSAERLADTWLAIDPAERDIVDREMGRRHRRGDRHYELAAAEGAVTTWLSKRMSAEPDDGDLWRVVAEAARGAVDALIADRDLDDADYETLYGAWAEVMDGESEAPAPAPKSKAAKTAKGAKGAKESKGAKGKAKAKGPATAEDLDAADADESEFGPNTELVRRFFARLGELGLDDLQNLTAAWKEQDRRDLKQAHDEVRRLVKEDDSWRDQVREAQDVVSGWAERVGGGVGAPTTEIAIAGSASAIAVTAAALAGSGSAHTKMLEMERLLQAKREAVPAAVDAVTALVLADLLEPEDAETLFGPWADAIGEPDLPEFESEA